ncbi:MAG: hypothetical protein WCW26_05260, partial [Candidatus Buchananbacteria bacterium]
MTKYFSKLLIIFLLVFFLMPNLALAQQAAPVYLTLFYGDGCPHCHKELLFLAKLEKEFTNLKIRKLEIWYNPENANLMGKIGKDLNLKVSGVPLTVIGNQAFTGYLDDATTGQKIRQLVIDYSKLGCNDLVGETLGEKSGSANLPCPATDSEKTISLPWFGTIDFNSW